jgi:hypothetical protein
MRISLTFLAVAVLGLCSCVAADDPETDLGSSEEEIGTGCDPNLPLCSCVLKGTAACNDNDHDGVLNLYDNCPSAYNPQQEDCDQDGTGDACDDYNVIETRSTPRIVGNGLLGDVARCLSASSPIFSPGRLRHWQQRYRMWHQDIFDQECGPSGNDLLGGYVEWREDFGCYADDPSPPVCSPSRFGTVTSNQLCSAWAG